MTSAEELRVVAEVLASELPAEADVSGIALALRGDHREVTISTRTPGNVIGRRGVTTEEVRRVLAERLDDAKLVLVVTEVRPDDDPGSGPTSGDREPRSPVPDEPSAAASLAEPEST